MEKLKYYTVVIDGIDKSGKDTIAKYVWQLDKTLNVIVRGWPSLVVYAKKFNRQCKYELPYKNALYVYCFVDYEDWKIRCEIHNEKKIEYSEDLYAFNNAFDILLKNNYKIMYANTTSDTAFNIAKEIVNTIHSLNILTKEEY